MVDKIAKQRYMGTNCCSDGFHIHSFTLTETVGTFDRDTLIDDPSLELQQVC